MSAQSLAFLLRSVLTLSAAPISQVPGPIISGHTATLHPSLLLSCLLLSGWLLHHQPIAPCLGHSFISPSFGAGCVKKKNPETTSPMAHAQVFTPEHCPLALTGEHEAWAWRGPWGGSFGVSKTVVRVLGVRTPLSATQRFPRAVTKAMQKPVRRSACLQLCRKARCPAFKQGGGRARGV